MTKRRIGRRIAEGSSVIVYRLRPLLAYIGTTLIATILSQYIFPLYGKYILIAGGVLMVLLILRAFWKVFRPDSFTSLKLK